MAVKATQITYDISLEEIKSMLVRELGLTANDVTVQYNIEEESQGNVRDSWTISKVASVKVLVNPKR